MAIIIAAIILSGKAYSNLAREKKKKSLQGILLSVTAGRFIAFFYPVVVNYSLDHAFVSGGKGSLTPYTAIFFFALGAFVSTFFINPFFMRKPVEGPLVKAGEYFKGSFGTYMTGVLGGAIWFPGMVFSYMAAKEELNLR